MTAMAVHTRAASGVLHVDWPTRQIVVVAVPYEEDTTVQFRDEIWRESFARGAFSHLANTDPTRIRANREHDKSMTIGKVVALDVNDRRGLLATIQIAKTARGDDTLGLAADDCLSASVAFGVPRGGEVLNHATRTRRVTRAYLDHISLVESPAYSGARVLAVRSATPNLDAIARDPMFVWASLRAARRRTK